MISKAAYGSKYEKERKILASKKMLQRLPIVLA